MKFLQITFTMGVRDHRVLKRPWHSARSEQLLDGVNGLVDGRPSFRKRSVEERKLAPNGIAEGRIGKPRNIVKEDGDSRSEERRVGKECRSRRLRCEERDKTHEVYR